MVVQHNLTAMNSNRMLGLTTSAQAKSIEKLSSGYKINRAADDADGLKAALADGKTIYSSKTDAGTPAEVANVVAAKDTIIAASGGTIEDITTDGNGKIIVKGADVPETYEAAVELYNEDGSVAFEAGAEMTADEKDNIANYYTAAPTEEKEAVAGKDYVEATKNALCDKDGNEISANGLQFYYEDGKYVGGLYTDKEGTTAAESQIRDTDMVTEMVKYSNNNILAQANQSNQGVLSLLG